MKFSYECQECGKVNTVITPDLFTLGMGRDGASATEMGFGGMMMGSVGMGGGLPQTPGRNVPKELAVNCIHCKAKNIVTRP